MAYNQQLSVLGQVAPATTGTAGQVLVSAGSSASSYWASAIPVSAYSAQFNGSSYLQTASNAAFAFGTGDFTVEAWVYTTAISNTVQQMVVNVGGSGGFAFTLFSDRIHVAQAGIADLTDFATTFVNNTWYHVALVRSSGSLKGYVNGVQQGSSYTNSTSYTGSGITVVGAQYEASLKFTGYISNVRVIKGLAVYTGAFTPPTSPLGTSQAAGTNIAAVTPSQVSLLTCNGPGLIDSSLNAFTLTYTAGIVTSQFSPFSSFSAISRSATQTQTILTSGSGTYYTPSGVAWLRIRMIGGGGGGGGASSAVNGGSNGTNTVFGSSLLVAGGGNGAPPGSNIMATGGTGSIGSGATGLTIVGGSGTACCYTGYPSSGSGGNSVFGGGGAGVGPNGGGPGGAGATNSGGGGGGGNWNSSNIGWSAHGGAAGGYVEAYISNPAASYAYTVGAGGGGGAGTGGGTNGGGGGSGIIIVEENYSIYAANDRYTASYILVAGGGSGGVNSASGGGAGGFISGSLTITIGTTYVFIVGAGGAAASAPSNGSQAVGNNGVNSTAFGLTAIGGGGGGSNTNGGNGGSGGGQNGLGTVGQGNNGGTTAEAGGGGAGAVGGNSNSNWPTSGTSGAGGAGVASSITGSSVYYAGGGGGAGDPRGVAAGAGGIGGGGAGASSGGAAGTSGTANTGGGGGGSTYGGGGGQGPSGAGGSGVVIISVPTGNYTNSTTGSPTVTTNGNYKVLTFTQSGSYTA